MPLTPIHTPALQFGPILPELILTGTAIVVLLADAVFKEMRQRTLLLLSLLGIAGAAGASIWLWSWHGPQTVLAGAVYADRFAVVARLLILAVSFASCLLGYHYFRITGEARGELYPLILFAATGMTLISAAADLIVVFLALEILSLSLYVLTGFSFRAASGEASLKYFLLGAFSSAFFLYGIAMAYGSTGTTKIGGIAHALSGTTKVPVLALVAVGLLTVGFAFKVGAVPFHMWTPDVYQGAPTPVTAFMGAATKVAAFAALIRVFDVAFQPLAWNWTPVIEWLAVITMIVGSLLAIAQTDVKRLLAYSSIAHAGFILVGLTAANADGISSALFYLVAYSLMIVGAFGVVILVSAKGEERTSLTAYAGLARRSPVLAGLMTLFLLSLSGIPPLAGFIAKVEVFGAAVRAGHWQLVLVAVLASVVAAFFYLRVIVLMYMQEPDEERTLARPARIPLVTVSVPALLVVLFGVLPGIVLRFLESASILKW